MSAGLDLTGLVLPGIVEEHTRSEDGRRAEYVLQPLERGFGHTVGNSIRRVLLSSLPGCAIWAFRADGVQHEHQTIPGVVEDIHQVIQKLKRLVIVLDPGVDEAKLELVRFEGGRGHRFHDRKRVGRRRSQRGRGALHAAGRSAGGPAAQPRLLGEQGSRFRGGRAARASRRCAGGSDPDRLGVQPGRAGELPGPGNPCGPADRLRPPDHSGRDERIPGSGRRDRVRRGSRQAAPAVSDRLRIRKRRFRSRDRWPGRADGGRTPG